jgi:hypothetical protein
MGFQNSVRYDYTFGQPGEIKFDGPKRVQTGLINSASAAYNIVGATVFTQANSGGTFGAGGAGIFVGILANPKVYASVGNATQGPLGATMTLPNNVQGEFLIMGEICVSVPAACNIGDVLTYNTTTGAIGTVPPGTAAPAGFALVPNAVIEKFPQTGAGLAVARLTN